MKTTATHVFFWSGPLSNWHLGVRFAGARAYAETVRRLDALGIARPSDDALSSRLLRLASFSCGEQWMMATKCWLVDRNPVLDSTGLDDVQAAEALALILSFDQPEPGARGSKIWSTPLGKTLRTNDPRAQKAFGREISPYDDVLWSAARVACVVGGNVARFEADRKARSVLVATQKRVIVEGSPSDDIWGVGLKWDDPRIVDPANWRGQNLLGVALTEVREQITGATA
jgi:ribA/ribD-fused uncharacterized protein